MARKKQKTGKTIIIITLIFLSLSISIPSVSAAVDPSTLRYCSGRLSSSAIVPDQPISIELFHRHSWRGWEPVSRSTHTVLSTFGGTGTSINRLFTKEFVSGSSGCAQGTDSCVPPSGSLDLTLAILPVSPDYQFSFRAVVSPVYLHYGGRVEAVTAGLDQTYENVKTSRLDILQFTDNLNTVLDTANCVQAPVPKSKLTLSLSGPAVDQNTITIKSGESATVTLTATVADPTIPTTVTFGDFLSIQGVSAHYESGKNSCVANPLCTVSLVIETEKADVNAPDFPNNKVGAVPGVFPFVLRAAAADGAKTHANAKLKVTSGEMKITALKITALIQNNGIAENFLPGSTLIVERISAEQVVYFYISSFPADDSIQTVEVSYSPSLTLSAYGIVARLSTYDKKTRTSTPTGTITHCSPDQLRETCPVGFGVRVRGGTPTGDYPMSITINSKPRFDFTPHVVREGVIDVIGFVPMEYRKGVLEGICKASIDPTLGMVAGAAVGLGSDTEQPAVPTFKFIYKDSGKAIYESDVVEGKRTQLPNEYEARVPLPLRIYNGDPTFECQATIKVEGETFTASSKKKNLMVDPSMFVLDGPGGKILCSAILVPVRNPVGIHIENTRLTLRLLKRDGSELLDDTLKPAVKPAVSVKKGKVSLWFDRPAITEYVKDGDKIVCQAEIEIYDKHKVKTTPNTLPDMVFTKREAKNIGQECVPITEDGFGTDTKRTIQFIGVGKSQEEYEEGIKNTIAVLKDDKIFSKYIDLFALKKVKYPWPEDPEIPEGDTRETAALFDIETKASNLPGVCNADFTINIGRFTGNGPAMGHTNVDGKYLSMFSPNGNVFREIFAHEAGHLLGHLDDEYVYKDPEGRQARSNCLPLGQAVSENRLVCPEWKDYPDNAACLQGCISTGHYRSTDNSRMNDKWRDPRINQFSVVQCAHLIERLEQIKDPARTFDFERGMNHCKTNIQTYNLVSQPAAIAP